MLLFQSPPRTESALSTQSPTWKRNPLCFAAGGVEAAELGGNCLPRGLQSAKLRSTGTAKLLGAEVQGKFVQSDAKAAWSGHAGQHRERKISELFTRIR